MFVLDTDMWIYLIDERDEALRDTFDMDAAGTYISSTTYPEMCFSVFPIMV